MSGIAQAKANPNQRKACKSLQIEGSARDGPKADWHEGEEGDGQNKQPRGLSKDGLGCHAGRSTGCRERVKASFGLPDVHAGIATRCSPSAWQLTADEAALHMDRRSATIPSQST